MECLEELYCDDTAIQEPPSSISLLKKLKILSFHGCKPLASRTQCSFLLSRVLPRSFQDTKASPSLSLSGLSSLVNLDISDCSMLDGGIPGGLGELHSLELLNLSNNKFVSIPAKSIAGLTRLKELYLVGCGNLETFPEFPSSIEEVYADECTSLKNNIDLLTKCPKLLCVSFAKCDQLLQDQCYSHMVDSLWQQILKLGLSMEHHYFTICFPGSVIPEWYTYKNWGPSLSVNLPQNWYNNKFMGVAVCVVSKLINTSTGGSYGSVSTKYGHHVLLDFKTHDGRPSGITIMMNMGWKGTKHVDSQLTCLAFLSHHSDDSANELGQVKICSCFDGLVYTGFGMHLVYEDDIKSSDGSRLIQNNAISMQIE